MSYFIAVTPILIFWALLVCVLIKEGKKDAQAHPADSKASEVYTVSPENKSALNRFKLPFFNIDYSHTFEGVQFDKLPEERAKRYAQWLINEGFEVNVTIPGHEELPVNVVWDV
ncbi:MAG: hypothetical protein ACLFQA_00255 [Bacteroidales bacterium]